MNHHEQGRAENTSGNEPEKQHGSIRHDYEGPPPEVERGEPPKRFQSLQRFNSGISSTENRSLLSSVHRGASASGFTLKIIQSELDRRRRGKGTLLILTLSVPSCEERHHDSSPRGSSSSGWSRASMKRSRKATELLEDMQRVAEWLEYNKDPENPQRSSI